jgi:hypothetical protein
MAKKPLTTYQHPSGKVLTTDERKEEVRLERKIGEAREVLALLDADVKEAERAVHDARAHLREVMNQRAQTKMDLDEYRSRHKRFIENPRIPSVVISESIQQARAEMALYRESHPLTQLSLAIRQDGREATWISGKGWRWRAFKGDSKRRACPKALLSLLSDGLVVPGLLEHGKLYDAWQMHTYTGTGEIYLIVEVM